MWSFLLLWMLCTQNLLRLLFFPFSTSSMSKQASTPVVPWLSYSPLDPRFAGSNPAEIDAFFQNVKILTMTSSGREVKAWVPCRRFT